MASTTPSSDGPILNLINKRLRSLRKKLNRITQIEESISQNKTINKEQQQVLSSKPSITASIHELEKLRQPLSSAVSEEIKLAINQHPITPPTQVNNKKDDHLGVVEDLLNLLYFGTMFDVKTQNDYTSLMLTRTHERGCCLTYDYVTDDENAHLLREADLDLISTVGALLISRSVHSGLSHKNALQSCIHHAKLWLANSDQTIEPQSSVTYAGLREKLTKIMGSDYFTKTPEMKAPVDVVAVAGNYASFSSLGPVQVEASAVEEEVTTNLQINESYDDQHSPLEAAEKGQYEVENSEEVSYQTESVKQQVEEGQNQQDVESKENRYGNNQRQYQNQRGGRGQRQGCGGRFGGRVGGPYQNGRNQSYEQPGHYYQRIPSYNNNRGRGGRGSYNNHNGPTFQASEAPADS